MCSLVVYCHAAITATFAKLEYIICILRSYERKCISSAIRTNSAQILAHFSYDSFPFYRV